MSSKNLQFIVNDRFLDNKDIVTTISHEADIYEDEYYKEVTLTVHPKVIVSPSADGLYQMSAEITRDTSRNQQWAAMWCGFGNGFPFNGGLSSCAAFSIKKDNPLNPGYDPETYNLMEGETYDCGLHFELYSEDLIYAHEPSEVEIILKGWPVDEPENITECTLICRFEPVDRWVSLKLTPESNNNMDSIYEFTVENTEGYNISLGHNIPILKSSSGLEVARMDINDYKCIYADGTSSSNNESSNNSNVKTTKIVFHLTKEIKNPGLYILEIPYDSFIIRDGDSYYPNLSSQYSYAIQ